MINNFLKKISKYDGDKYLKIALANTPGYNTLTKAATPAQQGVGGVRQRAQNAFNELNRSTQQAQAARPAAPAQQGASGVRQRAQNAFDELDF